MKVTNINYEDKTFDTEDGETYPLMFNVKDDITLDVFQALIDRSDNTITELLM